MNKINFIKGKWIVTKSIDDFTIIAHFEISNNLFLKLYEYLNKELILEVTIWTETYTYTSIIDTSQKGYLNHAVDHWVVRLDIKLKNLKNVMLMWIIVIWELKLLLPKK